ncbi:MAG: hypothetical protein GOMPHAMPRED_006624 [Gomphillus americanus]|uniref:G-patch domain-containing protein n=1 Tax=Gomphillus americanus TaxID=1940652 RepID=A0A8H3FX92_9LECA|nr:MAG: hypothetical protein GOMPHAMPRED_006624 [Gomphillus americanus]
MTATEASAPKAASKTEGDQGEEEEEDDYLSMAIIEPAKSYQKETYTQRRIRKQHEAESKNPKSKAQLATEAAAAQAQSLSTAIPQTSKGFKMLSKFGFIPGDSLGAKNNPHARMEPIELDMKIDRGGIGMDSEKKRKFKDAVEEETKRAKLGESDFRERVSREREVERLERLVVGAMKVAERMDEDERLESDRGTAGVAAELAPVVEESEGLVPEPAASAKIMAMPTKNINVLWRGLARQRLEKERDRRMRHDLMQSLSRNSNYIDDEADSGKAALETAEEEVEEDDPELEEFNALEPDQRLQKLVAFLREKFHYCFWCKYQYEDANMEGCPGITEEDHD